MLLIAMPTVPVYYSDLRNKRLKRRLEPTHVTSTTQDIHLWPTRSVVVLLRDRMELVWTSAFRDHICSVFALTADQECRFDQRSSRYYLRYEIGWRNKKCVLRHQAALA